jgi:hypothetical protein
MLITLKGTRGRRGRNDAACRRRPGVIRGRSLCISHGQTRCGCRRNPDTDKSPAGRKVARIRIVLRNVHHRFEQKFQNSPLSNLPY